MMYFIIMRRFWDFTFNNPDKIKPIHIAIFCFLVEHCNRLGWKKKFGLPTMMTIEAIGVKSVTTYAKALGELEEMKLIQVIEKSKNQWSANIIAISKFDEANREANDMALDRARSKHMRQHSQSTIDSTVTIVRHNTIDNRKNFLSFFQERYEIEPNKLFRYGTKMVQKKIFLWHMFETLGYNKEQCAKYFERIHDRNYCDPNGDPYTVESLVNEVLHYHKKNWLAGDSDE